MGAGDQSPAGECLCTLISPRYTGFFQPATYLFRTPGPELPQPLQPRLQFLASGIHTHANKVYRLPAPGDRDLDAGNEPHALSGSLPGCISHTLSRVVAGQGQHVNSTTGCMPHQFRRRQCAIRSSGVGV